MLYPNKRGSTETTLYANKELLSARRVTVATKENGRLEHDIYVSCGDHTA